MSNFAERLYKLARPPVSGFRLFPSIDEILDGIRRASGDDWTTQRQDWPAAVYRFIMDAEGSLRWVSGELDPEFFQDPQAIELLDHKLGHQPSYLPGAYGFDYVRLIFATADASSPQAAEGMISQHYQELAGIKHKYQDRLSLLWTSSRPRIHFMVEGDHGLHEEPDHPPGLLPYIMTRRDRKWAREWAYRFDAIAANGELAHELFRSASHP